MGGTLIRHTDIDPDDKGRTDADIHAETDPIASTARWLGWGSLKPSECVVAGGPSGQGTQPQPAHPIGPTFSSAALPRKSTPIG